MNLMILLKLGPLLLIVNLFFSFLAVAESNYEAKSKDIIKGELRKFIFSDSAKALPNPVVLDMDENVVQIGSNDDILVINFWATWCAPCISELPSLSKLQEKLNNTKFKLLLISIDRSGEKVFKPFLKKIGLTSLKSGNDPKTLLMQKLGLTGIPTTLLVSPTGEVVGKLVGTAKWDTRSAIDLVNFYLQK